MPFEAPTAHVAKESPEYYYRKRIESGEDFWQMNIKDVQAILAQFPQSKTVLDIGCGIGTLAFQLAMQDKNVTAVDAFDEAIEKAQEKKSAVLQENDLHSDTVSFRVMNIEEESLEGSYDLIFMKLVFQLLKDPETFLEKIKPHITQGLIIINPVQKENEELRDYHLSNMQKALLEKAFGSPEIIECQGRQQNDIVSAFLYTIKKADSSGQAE